MLPYSRQWIDQDDIETVVEVLRSDWLTTGPEVGEFELAVADYVRVRYAVAVSSGTAALHCAMYAIDIGPGDEVIVPPMTFAATANCIAYQGATPVFVDVDSDTLLIAQGEVEDKITSKTKAIIAVDFAGQPCDYDMLAAIADRHDLALVADGCHALGAEYKGRPVGCLADLTVFSFHPVKHICTGEGGMITTDKPEYEKRLRLFRNHGINADFHQREQQGSWYYEMVDLGYNYRITDIQCALGRNQMKRLSQFLEKRRKIAARYDQAFAQMEAISPLAVRGNVLHAYHLYVIRINEGACRKDRAQVFHCLREKGIGVNVHYIPIHLHPYYRKRFGTGPGMCPVAEKAYEGIISLPMFPRMTDNDVDRVIKEVRKVFI